MNFIIYEDNNEFVSSYKEVIFSVMSHSNIDYNTIVVNKYDEDKLLNVTGKKIYLLDVEVPGKNGIDVARCIRNNNDWSSPIIVITSHDEYKTVGYTSRILMLDFITKNDSFMDNLKEALLVALKINGEDKCYCISHKNEVIQIPYSDILYFEKNLNDNDCIVVTKDNEYVIRKSIVTILDELNDSFCKSHRSCIVNINNIRRVDFDNNIIYFDNSSIDLLSRSNRKSLKEKMGILNDK